MAALGVHQHRVDQIGIALPLEPRALGPAGLVDGVPALEHQALGDLRVARRRGGAQPRQLLPAGEGLQRRQVQAGRVRRLQERLQPSAALGKGQGAQVLLAVGQDVVGADGGGELRHQLAVHRLAVEPLLQLAEGRDLAAPDHQQLAVDDALEVQRAHQVGEGAGDLVARAAVEPALAPLDHRLDADAVPLPFGGVVVGVELGEVDRLVDRLGQHHRTEAAVGLGARTLASALQPGEQVAIGRGLAVPDLLDVGDRHAAPKTFGHVRQGLFGQPRRQAHAQAAGHQLEQGPAAVGIQRVEPALQKARHLAALGRAQGLHDLVQLRLPVGPPALGPDQGHGLGQVADIVVGPAEQYRVDPPVDRLADHGRLGRVERQLAGERRQRPAALGIGALLEVVAHQDQLGVARRRQGQTIEQGRKSAHDASLTHCHGLGRQQRPLLERLS